MSRRMTFMVGMGVGYVLGTRAGRERYETIARAVRRIKDNPSVQSSAGAFQTQAGNALHTVRHRIGVPGRHTHAEHGWWNHKEPAATA